jgi:hypothetical protein
MAEPLRTDKVAIPTPKSTVTPAGAPGSIILHDPGKTPGAKALPPRREGDRRWWQQWVDQMVDIFSGLLLW